ncbi:hypothetical protein FQR65_LT18978 [Abscondita terminalis]|nr:hypothetical protein FQR65_LT18978 [Abscondita terminalis]
MIPDAEYPIAEAPALKLQKNDRLSIQVSAKSPELAAPFNTVAGTYKVTRYPESYYGALYGGLELLKWDEDASLLKITLTDQSVERASDVLESLIDVYNDVYLQDKNQIAVNTAEFIKDRLDIIEGELGAVESTIEGIKVENKGVDVSTAGGIYFGEVNQYKSESTNIETNMRLVEMMRTYLNNKGKKNSLIPSNTGLVEGNVEGQIAEYNIAVLKRNRLAEGGTSNPVVQDMDDALDAMRSNISRAVDMFLKDIQ